jgi:hypothetical protein
MRDYAAARQPDFPDLTGQGVRRATPDAQSNTESGSDPVNAGTASSSDQVIGTPTVSDRVPDPAIRRLITPGTSQQDYQDMLEQGHADSVNPGVWSHVKGAFKGLARGFEEGRGLAGATEAAIHGAASPQWEADQEFWHRDIPRAAAAAQHESAMQDETLKHAMNWESVTGINPLTTGEPSRALQQMLAIYGPNGVRQIMAGAAMMNAQAHSQDVQSKVYYRGRSVDNQDDVLKIRRAQGVLAGYKAGVPLSDDDIQTLKDAGHSDADQMDKVYDPKRLWVDPGSGTVRRIGLNSGTAGPITDESTGQPLHGTPRRARGPSMAGQMSKDERAYQRGVKSGHWTQEELARLEADFQRRYGRKPKRR